MNANGTNGEAQPQAAAQILITMMPNGEVQVAGPLHNKIVCYGLLEVARQIVAAHKIEQPSIVPARFNAG